MLNDSIRYQGADDNSTLYADAVPLTAIAAQVGTPTYIYSLPRALANLRRIQAAFAGLNPHIHYSAKANANLTLLRSLIAAGAGIDAVSAGEVHRALLAGAKPADIVFAGVGKTPDELRYAVEQGVGWFNVENRAELDDLNTFAGQTGHRVQIALRLNPEVTANTHPYIATGHGGAKFGLTADTIREILAQQAQYPHLTFQGVHVHIGSQLGDTAATVKAVEIALEVIAPYPQLRTINIGGGLPVAYRPGQMLPAFDEFAAAVTPLLDGYQVMLEPGRSIIADAGVLLVRVLYRKQQAGQTLVIVDGSMTELIRPALYQAHHEIVPLTPRRTDLQPVQIVGPVCETSDVLGRDVLLPDVEPGDVLAILTAGAYGMVMASNYNARPRPPEVVILLDGQTWQIARRRETWADLTALEM